LRRLPDVADEKKLSRRIVDNGDPSVNDDEPDLPLADSMTRVKFEIFGEEMIEKRVKASGNSGRVYLPPDWVGHKVKIIRID
jgi:putative transposon-encoded protein